MADPTKPQVNAQLTPITLPTPMRPIKVTLPTQPPAPSPTTSTGTKVAVGAAAVAGTSLVTVAIISAATGWTITKVLDRGWDKLTGKRSKRRA